jgi:hypothetical protein
VLLAASFYIRTDEPATVTFRIEGGGAEWTVDPRVGLALEHQISLLGLRVDADHQIVAVATDASGNETAFEAIQFRTDLLPEDFPRFVLEHDVPVLVGESLVASGPRAPPTSVVVSERWPIDSPGSILRVPAYFPTDRTPVSPERASDLGLRASLFAQRGQCIPLPRGELAVGPHESLLDLRRQGRF